MGGLQHEVSKARAGRDLDGGEALGVAGALLLGDHAVVGGKAGLGLGLAGLGARPHPLQLAGHGALASLALGLLLDDALGLLLQPAGVVALVGDTLSAVELQGPLGHLVQEVTVVGHQDDATREGLQVVLKPGHALGVEVVGGLVQQQHVGLREQEPRQGDPALLPPREVFHAPVVRRAAQGVHGHLDLGVDVPHVAGVDLLLEGGHLLHELVGVVLAQLAGDLVEPGDEALFLTPGFHVLADVEGRIELGLLLQVTHLHAIGRLGLAVELLVQAGQDLEQGRLTRPVDPDHPDLRVGVEGQPDVLEHLLAAGIDLGQALHLENVLLRHGACGLADRGMGRPAR